MLNKINNKLIYLLLLFLSCIIKVNASDNIDFTKLGSIKISIQEKIDNTPIAGVELGLYHIANATSSNYNLVLEYTNEYEECPININEEYNLEDIIECTNNKEPNYKETTNIEGISIFNNLKLGLYLVKQENKLTGYSNISPYLVIIPKLINNKWTYNIDSIPKTEIYKTISLKVIKEWNIQNENSKIPESITIRLLKDNNIIDIVTLNEENNWTHIWHNLERSDTYSIEEINIPKEYTVTYKKQDYTFIVTNTDKLPHTGQINWPIPLLFILGLILIIIGIYYLKRNNNEK